MAIGNPTLLFTIGGTSSPQTGTVSGDCPVGQPILVSFDGNPTAGATPVTDSKNNTWTQLSAQGATMTYMAVPTSGKNLVNGTDTITVTIASATRISVLAVVGTGYVGTPTKDVEAHGTLSGTTSFPTADLVTTQAAAMLWAAEVEVLTGTPDTISAPATNWTKMSDGTASAASGLHCRCAGQYRIVSATGTYSSSSGGGWTPTNATVRATAVAIYDATVALVSLVMAPPIPA